MKQEQRQRHEKSTAPTNRTLLLFYVLFICQLLMCALPINKASAQDSFELQRPSSAEAPAAPQDPIGSGALRNPATPYIDQITPTNTRTPWWVHGLLWIPNRVMDALDVFKIDAGIGPSIGVVARFSKNGQAGYRQMMPLSVRGGIAGRRPPFFVESGMEVGVSPMFRSSQGRTVCPGEIGVGADLLIVGGYGGICVDQLIDFLAGLVFIDPIGDDLK